SSLPRRVRSRPNPVGLAPRRVGSGGREFLHRAAPKPRLGNRFRNQKRPPENPEAVRRRRSERQLATVSAARTLFARGPFGLCSMSKSTFSPPLMRSKSRDAWSALRWKKYSLPSSAVMKPKPRSEMTFLTVPVVTLTFLLSRTGEQTHGPFEKRSTTRSTATHRGSRDTVRLRSRFGECA